MMPLTPALLALLAVAPGETVAIVETDSPDVMIGLAFQVTNALVDEAKAQGYTVLAPEQLRATLDQKKLAELRRCGGKPTCAAQLLQGSGAKKVVLGSLNKDERNYLLKLWLIDLDTMNVVADVDRAILIAARRFQKDMQQAVPSLLRGEREARGTLVLNSTVANVQISVNGEFVGVAPLTQQLKPGKYQIKAEKKKYLPIARLLAVEANQTTTEDFKMILKPGEVADENLMPAMVAQQAAPSGGPDRPVHLTARTWIAGGAMLIAGGAGAWFGLGARAADQKLLSGYDPASDTYSGSRATALGVQRDALIANVSFGVTAALLATTLAFAVFDASGEERAQLAPAITPGGTGLVVGGRF